MAVVKCIALFQLQTTASQPNNPEKRLGGWSESWYSATASSIDATIPIFQTWCQRRVGILSTGAAIVGQRYQIVSPAGAVASRNLRYPGLAGPADQPQAALLMKGISTNGRNRRLFTWRGIPDSQIVEGEYSGNGTFPAALQVLINNTGGWSMRARVLTATTYPLLQITSAGVFTTEVDHPFADGAMVRVLRSRDANGITVSGRFQVIAPITARTGTLFLWPTTATKGGSVRSDSVDYYQINAADISVLRAVVKKVGRPFTPYRGRATQRH